MRETWSAWTPMRGDIDVTEADVAIDGLTAGRQLTDFSVTHKTTDLPPGEHTVQVGFYSEASEDDTSSFGCELWASIPNGPAQKVCDVTGWAGPSIADMTNPDCTARLFYDDLTVADSTFWGDVTTRGLLGNGMGVVEFTSRGASFLYPRFYKVGGALQAKRIKAFVRAY